MNRVIWFLWFVPFWLGAADLQPAPRALADNVSLRQEVERAVERGLKWLEEKQHPGGGWSDTNYPGISALALTATMGELSGKWREAPPAFVKRGYQFLLASARPDGGIYRTNLGTYNTSLAVMALVAANQEAYLPVIRAARRYIIAQQNDFNVPGKVDSPLDGGIGYGGSRAHADMSNTLLALEALYHSRHVDSETVSAPGLNWEAVVGFIERCQNLPAVNREPWASADAQNLGGFVYFPGHSMAGETPLPGGRTALRSYGSMSYAGLLSYLYARVDRNDPRTRAVYDWLRRNFTLKENPGLGAQGLYYYFHTMAKALGVHGGETLTLADGRPVDWRSELARRLVELQRKDGSWSNDNNRWWESDPVLATSYALLALEWASR